MGNHADLRLSTVALKAGRTLTCIILPDGNGLDAVHTVCTLDFTAERVMVAGGDRTRACL